MSKLVAELNNSVSYKNKWREIPAAMSAFIDYLNCWDGQMIHACKKKEKKKLDMSRTFNASPCESKTKVTRWAAFIIWLIWRDPVRKKHKPDPRTTFSPPDFGLIIGKDLGLGSLLQGFQQHNQLEVSSGPGQAFLIELLSLGNTWSYKRNAQTICHGWTNRRIFTLHFDRPWP